MRPLEWITIIILLVAWGGLIIPAKIPPPAFSGMTADPLPAAAMQPARRTIPLAEGSGMRPCGFFADRGML